MAGRGEVRMTHDNFVKALRAFSRRRHFEPFLVQLMTGDLILIMGARDPVLTDLARGILAGLQDRARNLISGR